VPLDRDSIPSPGTPRTPGSGPLRCVKDDDLPTECEKLSRDRHRPGAEMRQAEGTAVFTGMLGVTIAWAKVSGLGRRRRRAWRATSSNSKQPTGSSP